MYPNAIRKIRARASPIDRTCAPPMDKSKMNIIFFSIIAILLWLQFYSSGLVAKKYDRDHIRGGNDTFYQPSNGNKFIAKPPPHRRVRHSEGPAKPRVVHILDKGKVLPIKVSIIPYYHPRYNETMKNATQDIDDPPIINSTWYEPNAAAYLKDKYDLQVCQPMHDWQLQSFPNCNSFHELDFTKMRYITSGTRRSAFEMREAVNGRENQFVYKSVMWNNGKPINEKRVEVQRVDALVLEKLHSSKFIPSINGYCSLGILMDFTPEGTLHDYLKGVRLSGGSTLSPVDRLRITIHIAAGVADLHSIDGSPIPSFYHDDLDWLQYLYVDGIFMLNDFNYAKPIYVKKNNTEEVCKLTKGHMGIWKNRALEEFQAKANWPDFTPFRPDTIDVWMMGNLIYTVMTDLYPFEKPQNLNRVQAGIKLVYGNRTEIPTDIRESHDPSYKAMMEALDMCWTYKWEERPSARIITDYLMGELRNITGQDDPDLRVKLPERDPDQRNTESDYLLYNDGAND